MASQGNSSTTPILVIVGIGFALVLGIYLVSQSGAEEEPSNSTIENTGGSEAALKKYNEAPAGATPANVLGSQTAPVVLEEFADFQCPTCARVHPVVKEVISNYGQRIKYVYRSYPLPHFANSYEASLSAEAAGLQGKFFQMQDLIFKNQATWANQRPNARATFKQYAQRIGLDVAKFEADVTGMNAKARVDQDVRRANALGVNSTPSFFLNGRPLDVRQITKESLPVLLDKELKKYEKKDSSE